MEDRVRDPPAGAARPGKQGLKAKLITLINVFTVAPADQERLIEILTQATELFVRHAPGFIAATLNWSLDGTKVTMHAQWRSPADYQAMREDPRPRPFLEEALSIATFEPGMYEVARSFAPDVAV